MMNRFVIYILLYCFSVFSFFCNSAIADLDLAQVGQKKIGFKVVDTYDYSRSYTPKFDAYGELSNVNSYRPMKVVMWYPTETATDISLSLLDYYSEHQKERDGNFDSPKKILKKEFSHLAPEDFERLYSFFIQPRMVYRNAPLSSSLLPVILYAPSKSGSFFENAKLCELLARQGYLVVTTTAKGQYSFDQRDDIDSIHNQVDDIAFLAAFAKTISYSDKMSTLGFSRGGLSNLLFAMKNKNVDATISLDSSIMSTGWLNDIKKSSFYRPEKLQSNLLLVTKNKQNPSENPDTFYQVVNTADKALIRLDHQHHRWFSYYHLAIYQALAIKTHEDFSRHYDLMCEYVVAFLNYTYQKERSFVKQISDINHSFVIEKRSMPTLLPENIRFWIMNRGIDYVADTGKVINSKDEKFYEQVNWQELIDIAKQLMNEKDYISASKVLQFGLNVKPGWYEIEYLLALCFEKLGNIQKAISTYHKSIIDHPKYHPAIDAIMRLTGNTPAYSDKMISPSEWQKYTGKYVINEKDYRLIYIENNQLFMTTSYWSQPLQLWPYEKTRFLVLNEDPKSNIQVLFQKNTKNEVIALQTRGLNSGRLSEINYKLM